jgi:ribosomal protein S18 acetylase RimI-like enzyme
MSHASWDSYVRFRTRAMLRLAAIAGLELVEEPGLVAVLSREPGSRGALLVTDAVPEARLDAALSRGYPMWIALLPAARGLAPAAAARGWAAQDDRVAMTHPDLQRLPLPPLPPDVQVLPVAVRQGSEGYPLVDAVRLSLSYGEVQTPAAVRDLEIEARLLRSLPGIQFYAAVGPDGTCIGTAGSRVVQGAALVASVATDVAQRRRGIGTALTAVALRGAAAAGAREAYLDATAEGVGIYRRLGFVEIGPVRWCERSEAIDPPPH